MNNHFRIGGKKDEDKIGDDQKPEQDQNAEEVQPSEDKPSNTAAESASAEKGSKDLVIFLYSFPLDHRIQPY